MSAIPPLVAADRGGEKCVLRASRNLTTSDKYKEFQCKGIGEVARRMIRTLENGNDT